MEIEIIIYKESGKYYTDERMTVPECLQPWDYKDYIIDNLEGRYKGMFLTSYYPNEVPFLLKL